MRHADMDKSTAVVTVLKKNKTCVFGRVRIQFILDGFMFQGEVKFLTGGNRMLRLRGFTHVRTSSEVRELCVVWHAQLRKVDSVKSRNQRYSPDERGRCQS